MQQSSSLLLSSPFSSSSSSSTPQQQHKQQQQQNEKSNNVDNDELDCSDIDNDFDSSNYMDPLIANFVARSGSSNQAEKYDGRKHRANFLVVGDGDLSYCAQICKQLQDLNIRLFATVLESQDHHRKRYLKSTHNADYINSFPNHKVLYEIDCTKLHENEIFFTSSSSTTSTIIPGADENDDDNKNKIMKFDRIIFNFPHWKGKANNKYNRVLMDDFLRSAKEVLHPTEGEIHIALFDNQGGSTCNTINEWRQSWMVSMYGNENGLLLQRLEPFEPYYNLSSYREMDKPFRNKKKINHKRIPMRYVFVHPTMITPVVEKTIAKTEETSLQKLPSLQDGQVAPSISEGKVVISGKQLQVCCRHEVRIMLPDLVVNDNDNDLFSKQTQENINNSNDDTSENDDCGNKPYKQKYKFINNEETFLLRKYYNYNHHYDKNDKGGEYDDGKTKDNDDGNENTSNDIKNISNGIKNINIDNDKTFILNLIKDILPKGVRVEIPKHFLILPKNDDNDTITTDDEDNKSTTSSSSSGSTSKRVPLLVFLLIYCGETIPLTRTLANRIRDDLELFLIERYKIQIAKRDRLVSRPFPYRVLEQQLQDEHAEKESQHNDRGFAKESQIKK